MAAVKDLLKHSSIYSVGQILSRFASVLLLPLYTRCLSPDDYGCVAILDLVAGIFAIVIGAGMAQAVVRFHFDNNEERHQQTTWWTGIVWVVSSASLLCGTLLLARDWLADISLGSDFSAKVNGPWLYVLAIGTLWFNTIAAVFEAHVAVRKWSLLYVCVSLGRLVLNIGLNVWFLVGLEWGVAGLLTGNLIASAANTIVLALVICPRLGRFQIKKQVVGNLLRFGSPLIVTALLSLMMHEADRYFLRVFGNLGHVGVYSLAYKIGQAVNTLCLVPFAAIWNVVLYEIAQQENANQTFARVFKFYVYGLLVVMLAASLFAHPLLPLLTPGEFDQATDLIPIILLAFVFFSLHSQFSVPALIAKRTTALIPATCAGVVVNVVGNALLVPQFGATGSAWASVLTYAAFSFVGLTLYRRIDLVRYPFGRILMAATGVALTFCGVRFILFDAMPLWGQLISATVACVIWFVVLFGPVLKPIVRMLKQRVGKKLSLSS